MSNAIQHVPQGEMDFALRGFLNSLRAKVTDIDNGGLYGTATTAQATGYTTFSNLSTDRTCDADATTVAELADILGTLIEDLKLTGIIAE